MPIDREASLKKAEKLLRQGKLDGAIEEYVRLIEEQPRDWNSINALGDLYVRARDVDRAVDQFAKVADHLVVEGFLPRAAALYKKALKVKGDHDHTLLQLAEIAVTQGLLADAKTYLRQLVEHRRRRGDQRGAAECLIRLRTMEQAGTDAQTAAALAGDDPDLLLSLARLELASANEQHARAIVLRVLTLAPERYADVTQIALDVARDGRLESALEFMNIVTDAALMGDEWSRAVDALQTFVRGVPSIPALIKLVELCVDAGVDAPLRDAQAQLADAYLEAGKGAEARFISEDLVDDDPTCEAHVRRLRRALEMLGVDDVERVVAQRARADTESLIPAAPEPVEEAVGVESVEIDLSDVSAAIDALASAPPPTDAGDPSRRFKTAAERGRVYIQRGELQTGVDWLERAAEASAPTPEDGFAVLYDLADALERLGEPARALALFIELEADASGYRDVLARIDRLGRVQTETRGR